jgi:hypothetical protein
MTACVLSTATSGSEFVDAGRRLPSKGFARAWNQQQQQLQLPPGQGLLGPQ